MAGRVNALTGQAGDRECLVRRTDNNEEQQHRSRTPVYLSVLAVLSVFLVVTFVTLSIKISSNTNEASELMTQKLVLFKMAPPPQPWSPPENLWMYWGDAPNKRFGHSGDNIRHLVRLGRLGGGEYRDPHFLQSFDTQTFRDLSEACCTTMLMAPMKNNMPVWNSYSSNAQRLRNYVANGNHMIFTGGSLVSLEFINTYFWYNLEPTSEAGHWKGSGYGNWSPGPWRKLVDPTLPWVYKTTPDTLYQDHTSVETVGLSSLPSGTRVLYMSPQSAPVFTIKFCQRLSSKHGEAPIKTLPRDCAKYAAHGYPCSCGTITYIGYDWHADQTSEAWDKVMLAAVEFQADTDTSATTSPNCPEKPYVAPDPTDPLPPPSCPSY